MISGGIHTVHQSDIYMTIQIRFNIAPLLSLLILPLFFFPASGRCGSTITIDADMQYKYAMERFQQRDFPTAIVELNRFIHFFPEDQRIKEVTLQKGISLLNVRRYGDAIEVFQALALPWSGDAVNVESYFMLSATFSAMGRDGSAESVMQDLLLLNDDSDIEDRALYNLVWIYLERIRQDHSISQKDASQPLVGVVRYIDRMAPAGKDKYKADMLRSKIIAATDTIEHNKKSPLVAGIASVIPGGGFAYCNRYHDALVAFLLNSAFVLAAVESFEDGNGALGGLIGFVGSGFYGGSIYGGISSAHKHNRAIIRNSIDNIRQNREIGTIGTHIMESTAISDYEVQNSRSHRVPLLSIKIPF